MSNETHPQFYLPIGEETKLISCGAYDVWGRTMPSGVAGDQQQWFDGGFGR
eukprot:gene53905-8638_t